MSEPVAKTISFRSQLTGELGDFLADEGFACADTTSALTALVAALPQYKEEGIPLSPDVYLCKDIRRVASLLQGSEVITIGRGPRAVETALKALKQCAPLARGGWAVFLERGDDSFLYGVFSATNLPLAITIDEILVEQGDDEVPAVMVTKLAENCVELRGCRGNRRCIHFSAAREERPSPKIAVEQLATAITADVAIRCRQPTLRFVYRMLTEILQQPHGVLAVVLKRRRRRLPGRLSSGIQLPEPVSVASRVSTYADHHDHEAMARLQGAGHLMRGMLHSDGIVVFRSDGTVLAYRAFLSGPAGGVAAREAPGGARRRTFEALKVLVDKDKLMAAFFRSQDGQVEYYGGPDG